MDGMTVLVLTYSTTHFPPGPTPPSAMVNSDESALFALIRNAGGNIGSITLGMSKDGSRGVYAERDIHEGEELLSVPASLILTAEKAAKHMGSVWRASMTAGTLHEIDVMCVHLIQMLQDVQDSSWIPWFSHLPATYDVPFLWHDSWLSLLRCPKLTAHVRDERRTYCDRLEKIEQFAKKNAIELPHLLSLKTFLWGVATIRTRGAYLHDDSGGENDDNVSHASGRWAVVPLGDMFNHAAGSRTVAKFDARAGSYRYVAGADIRAGNALVDPLDSSRSCICAKPKPGTHDSCKSCMCTPFPHLSLMIRRGSARVLRHARRQRPIGAIWLCTA